MRSKTTASPTDGTLGPQACFASFSHYDRGDQAVDFCDPIRFFVSNFQIFIKI
jgi:hypothetical protein